MRSRILLAILAIVFLATNCFGWGEGGTIPIASKWKSYVIENTTGVAKTTLIPTSTIAPNENIILGYEVMARNNSNAEVYIVLVDGMHTTDEVIGEAEAGVGYSASWWYPRPRILETSLTVVQGANTHAIIYFE